MDLTVARRKMIDCQIRPNDVTDESVLQAFEAIPREDFVTKANASLAYCEMELETISGRQFWLARDLSKVLQSLDVAKTDLILVIGAAEGYAASLLNEMGDTVIALEADEDVASSAADRLSKLGRDRVAYVTGDLKAGYAKEGPYDVIFVNGMVEYVPDEWLDQLSPGGRLAVVVGTGRGGQARVYKKSATGASFHVEFDCAPPLLAGFELEKGFVF